MPITDASPNARQQLSRGGAIAVGLLFIACGAVPLLMMIGMVPTTPARDGAAPAWMGIAIAAMFICAGLVIILEYAVGRGVDATGDLVPGTPAGVRVAVFRLGMLIVAMLDVTTGWVAFGPGPRHFFSSISIPFMALSTRTNDATGRVAFGIGCLMMTFMLVVYGIVGVRRLRGRRDGA